MNQIDFSKSGGYPLTQDTLRFMQSAYFSGLKGLGKSLYIEGNPVTDTLILSGIELQVVAGNLVASEGYVVWKGSSEIIYCPAVTMPVQAGQLYLNVQRLADAVLDPTYYSVTANVADVHINTFAQLSYTAGSNPADTCILDENMRFKKQISTYQDFNILDQTALVSMITIPGVTSVGFSTGGLPAAYSARENKIFWRRRGNVLEIGGMLDLILTAPSGTTASFAELQLPAGFLIHPNFGGYTVGVISVLGAGEQILLCGAYTAADKMFLRFSTPLDVTTQMRLLIPITTFQLQ